MFGLQLRNWVWTVVILFVIVLWSAHADAIWIATSVWHIAGAIISGLDHVLTDLRTNSGS